MSKKTALNHSDACFLGAAEAMKHGQSREAGKVTRRQSKAAARILAFCDGFADDELSLALLLLMVKLGRRVEAKEKNDS